MNYEFKKRQSEEYYRKLLLLNKVKPFLDFEQKQYIFNKSFCHDILFNDKDVTELCYVYAVKILKGPFPEGEIYISKNVIYSYYYAVKILKDRFELGESIISESIVYSLSYVTEILHDRFPLAESNIFNSGYKMEYIDYLKSIGKFKNHEYNI